MRRTRDLVLNLRLDRTEKRMLEVLARRSGLSLSAHVRFMVRRDYGGRRGARASARSVFARKGKHGL